MEKEGNEKTKKKINKNKKPINAFTRGSSASVKTEPKSRTRRFDKR